MTPPCPTCGTPLNEVRYNSDSMLNRDQWESQIAGNWFCRTCPGNGRGSSGYAYYWDHEVAASSQGASRG